MKTNARPVSISARRSPRMPRPAEGLALTPIAMRDSLSPESTGSAGPGRVGRARRWSYCLSAVSIADDVAWTTGAGSSLLASIWAVIALLNASLTLLKPGMKLHGFA